MQLYVVHKVVWAVPIGQNVLDNTFHQLKWSKCFLTGVYQGGYGISYTGTEWIATGVSRNGNPLYTILRSVDGIHGWYPATSIEGGALFDIMYGIARGPAVPGTTITNNTVTTSSLVADVLFAPTIYTSCITFQNGFFANGTNLSAGTGMSPWVMTCMLSSAMTGVPDHQPIQADMKAYIAVSHQS